MNGGEAEKWGALEKRGTVETAREVVDVGGKSGRRGQQAEDGEVAGSGTE